MSAARKPNIILINCDDLGYGDIGCYGSSVNDTPYLDRMAAEGVRFTDFYMAAPVCSPSRGAMLTGCYPPRIGFGTFENKLVLFPGQGVGMNQDEVTFGKLLQQQGYATKLVGKWHCGDQPEFLPTRHGFDSYFGLPYSNDMGRQVGRETSPPLPLIRDEDVIQQQPDQAALTERYVQEAVDFIRDNHEKPFLLYFAHMYVHLPLYAPQRFVKASRNGRYGACVASVDWSVGVLMHELERLGIENDTLMVFTSDNGARGTHGGSNAPLGGSKGTSWEGGFRLPCIARWPGRIKPGTVCNEVATSMDFLPTFARLAGADVPTDRVIDGKDIWPLMTGEEGAGSPHDAFFYYHGNALCAVRAGKWKLHTARRGKGGTHEHVQELYDLSQDIAEENNVFDAHPEVVAELEKHLERCREDIGDVVTSAPGANRRPIGKVDNPQPLTTYDESHPYIEAMYDLKEIG